MRIAIGPLEIAGYGSGLEQGFRSLGVTADFIVGRRHPFVYADARFPCRRVKWWWQVGAFLDRPTTGPLRKLLFMLAHSFLGLFVLLWVIPRYDAFIFFFGRTYTNTRLDLWLLRLCGRKSLFIFLGSDARPPYMDGAQCGRDPAVSRLRLKTLLQKFRVRAVERNADYIMAQYGHGQFFEKRYLDFNFFGLPRTVSVPAREPDAARSVVRILHSPSVELVKGSAIILEAVENLRRKGHAIELIKLHGVPNSVVMEEIARCDFVIDQLYSDIPMATFACEAAHLGRPAVVGGYFAPLVPQVYRPEEVPPTCYVLPEDIESAIERMITDPAMRRDLGRRAHDFVKANWVPEEVARRFLLVLQGKAEARWWVDPNGNRYIHGCGLSRERGAVIAARLLQRYGRPALCLSDKPELEELVVRHAAGAPAP